LYLRSAEAAAQAVRVGQEEARLAARPRRLGDRDRRSCLRELPSDIEECGRQFQWGWGDHNMDGAKAALQVGTFMAISSAPVRRLAAVLPR
jgi:hypothetical protein